MIGPSETKYNCNNEFEYLNGEEIIGMILHTEGSFYKGFSLLDNTGVTSKIVADNVDTTATHNSEEMMF